MVVMAEELAPGLGHHVISLITAAIQAAQNRATIRLEIYTLIANI